MGQVNTADVIAHQAAQLFESSQAITSLQAANQQLAESNRSLADRFRKLQEQTGLAPNDPLYINFEAAAQPPAPPSLQAAVSAAAANKAQRRAKKAA